MIIFGSNIRVICKRWRREGRGGGGGGGRTGEGVQGGITVGIVFNVSLTAHTSPVRLCDC